MKNYFAPLPWKDLMTLLGWIGIGVFWILVDQFFFQNIYHRFMVFIALMLGLLYLQLIIHKPERVWHYTNTIAAVMLTVIVSTSLVIHLVVRHDFSTRSVMLWVVSGAVPYVDCWLYVRE